MTHRKLGRYILVERLRTGGMAEVWRGLAEGPGGFLRKAAIKVILPAYTEDEDFLQMFKDEAAIAARLTHANIAQIHDFDVAEGVPYLAMEYVEGKDLRAVLEAAARRERPLPWEVAAGIALEVAKGLYYVHTLREASRPLSIVHRDISPQNIMVSYTGEVKIVDFGIARAAKRSSVTRTGEVKGKCAYMSPEQALGRMVDARSDQFSLGVVLWELLTGRRLFGGVTPAETVARLVRTMVPPPHEVREELPRELSPLVTRALNRDPGDRYTNLLVFYDALSRFLFDRDNFPTPHRLAVWLEDLFPEEVEAFHQGEADELVPNLDEAPLLVTELDTGEWRLLQEETEDETTRPMLAGELEETTTDREAANPPPEEDDFVPWDKVRPAAGSRAQRHPALRRTSARTVGLYLAFAFVGACLAMAGWAWILGLGPFKQDPLAPPVVVRGAAPDSKDAAPVSLMELDALGGPPEVISAELTSETHIPSVDLVDTLQQAQGRLSLAEGGGVKSESTDAPAPDAVEDAASDNGLDLHPELATAPLVEDVAADPEVVDSDLVGAVTPPAGNPLPGREHASAVPKPKAKRKRKAHSDTSTFGTVHVAARPYAQIRVDGRFAGVAPKDLRLPSGSHTIELEYLDARHRCRVSLEEGGEARCEHNFTRP